MTLTVGSVCSGIGGIDLGLERAGMEILWQCEFDKDARQILARHYPGIPCYPDLTEIDCDRLAAVDVLCGGTPCQDLSLAGLRAGLDGDKSRLFYDFVHVADQIAPSWVLWENVPGLLSSNGGADFGLVLRELSGFWPETPANGWEGGGICVGPKRILAWRVLDSQFFGVPQRRRRVFVVGCPGGAGALQVLFEPESLSGDPPPRRDSGTRVAALTANGVGTCGADDNQGQAGHLIPAVSHALTAQRGHRFDPNEQTFVAFHLTQDPISAHTTPAMGTGNSEGCATLGVAYNPYRTLEKDGSVTSGFAERPVVDALHGPTGNKEPLVVATAVRRLSPTECERLQGFPDGWTEGLADSARYRLLGNAVTVSVSEWIGHRIVNTTNNQKGSTRNDHRS